MPRLFFDPAGMQQLGRVYDQAKKALEQRGKLTSAELDMVAARLLRAAADGVHDEDALLEIALGGKCDTPKR